MTIDELKAKRDEAQAQLTAFVEQANRQVAAMEGAVSMLSSLIAEMEAKDAEAVND